MFGVECSMLVVERWIYPLLITSYPLRVTGYGFRLKPYVLPLTFFYS